MALIEKQTGRGENQTPSGYTRIFGIKEMGQLISKTHATSISAGTELERMIWDRVRQIKDFDEFINSTLLPPQETDQTDTRLWVACKKQYKKSKIIHSEYEPDFLGFDVAKRICYIIEVKDGDQFDTKKSAGEHTTMHNFTNETSSALSFSTHIYICSFNAQTKEEIHAGLKGKFAMNEIMTGREFCTLFGINFDEIVKTRTSEQQGNLEYFVKELLMINPIRNMIRKFLNNFKD